MAFGKVIAAAAASLVVLAACSGPTPSSSGAPQAQTAAAEQKADPRPRTYALMGQPIPAFRAELASGGVLTDKDLRGKWTVIDFWGIWCPDCMVDAPHVQALSTAIAQDPDLRFITVHVDRRYGRWSSVAEYMAEKQQTYPVLLDPDKSIRDAFQIKWVPSYLVVDPQGVVRGYRTDLSQDADPEGGVKAFIKQIAELRRLAPAAPAAPAQEKTAPEKKAG